MVVPVPDLPQTESIYVSVPVEPILPQRKRRRARDTVIEGETKTIVTGKDPALETRLVRFEMLFLVLVMMILLFMLLFVLFLIVMLLFFMFAMFIAAPRSYCSATSRR